MRRTFFFVHRSILRRIFYFDCGLGWNVISGPLFVWDGSSFFLPFLRGFKLYLYNGRVFRRIYVFRALFGQRFRFFNFTKLVGSGIHVRKRRGKRERS